MLYRSFPQGGLLEIERRSLLCALAALPFLPPTLLAVGDFGKPCHHLAFFIGNPSTAPNALICTMNPHVEAIFALARKRVEKSQLLRRTSRDCVSHSRQLSLDIQAIIQKFPRLKRTAA